MNSPTHPSLPSRWDLPAMRAGAGVCLLFAVPFSIGARLAADADNTNLAVALSIGAVIGFFIGSGCTACLQQRGTPLTHAMVTAGLTYLGAQAVFVIIRLITGNEVNWFGVFFNLSVTLGAGLLGGLVGQRLQQAGMRSRS